MKNEKGQSFLELLIAIGIFVAITSAITFLVLNSHISNRLGQEITFANYLAQEGIEAAKSIRDEDWNNLVDGSYGIEVQGGKWVFGPIGGGVTPSVFERVIKVETVRTDVKKVTSLVSWDFVSGRDQKVELVTYLTNWQKETSGIRVSFDSDNYSVIERAKDLIATVDLSKESKEEVRVRYRTEERTATDPEDYISVEGSLFFETGEVSQSFNVPIVDNSLEEPEEYFDLILFGPQGAILGENSQATGTIYDDDSSQGCWGIGGSCDSGCQYTNRGKPIDYYLEPDPPCNRFCNPVGKYLIDPSGTCSSDGTGECYKLEDPTTQSTECAQGEACEGKCGGTCTPCREITDPRACDAQEECTGFNTPWGFICMGTCTDCREFEIDETCAQQLGCTWKASAWYWNLESPLSGYFNYTNCEWYE